ncbi:MAG: hypothetical protein BKP49_01770 [Treponema sp. CETP13]|nr:MAG: hypothetical protein BKP49_01770 [Treponema sp. CETP13]
MIELKSFTKCYKNFAAVKNVSFIAPDNCVTALVGLNGAGKTTILKAISAMHYADIGSVLVNGIEVSESPIKVKRMCSFVTEQPHLYDNYTVSELLETEIKLDDTIPLSAIRAKKSIENRVFKILKKFSLTTVSGKKTKELSKGFKQRLSFACAFCSDPSVFLLDEPMSGLDPQQIIEMRKLIKDLSKNKTVLFSTHNMHEVEEICSLAIILKEGEVVKIGAPSKICLETKSKTFEEAFMKLTVESHNEIIKKGPHKSVRSPYES